MQPIPLLLESWVRGNDVGCVEVCIELVSLYFLDDLSGNDTFLNEGMLD